MHSDDVFPDPVHLDDLRIERCDLFGGTGFPLVDQPDGIHEALVISCDPQTFLIALSLRRVAPDYSFRVSALELGEVAAVMLSQIIVRVYHSMKNVLGRPMPVSRA